MPAPIPLSRPDITHREIEAVIEVLHTPTLSIGPKVEEFESLCARLTGRSNAVAVSSGTAALHCCMIAAGIGPGDEVVTTPFSFVASTNCILYVGARPLFVDIDPKTLNIDLNRVDAAVTPRTKAVVGVEALGHPGGMAELEAFARKRGFVLIEDSCEAFGGRSANRAVGSFGKASVFGFYPNKQITTGEGGMIVTDDEEFAATCRALRNQGRESMNWLLHQRLGYNYRLSEINAALGVAQLQRLDELLEARRHVAHQYIERLMTSRYLIVPTIPPETLMSWFVFVVRLTDLFQPEHRDQIMQHLRGEGIGCNNYFPPIHLQPYIARLLGHKPGDFPVCEYVADRTIALPFFGKLTSAQIDRVCQTLEAAVESVLIKGRKRF